MGDVRDVFLIGAKSLGVYGGYETFVNKLTEYHQNDNRIKYHVACKTNGEGCMNPYKTEGAVIINDKEFIFHNAHCFSISVPEKLGAAQAIYYDCAALKETIRIIKAKNIQNPIVYIMACRIGLFIKKYFFEIHRLGGKIYLNPDGHEWMRDKWPTLIKKYWKISEQTMVKFSDLNICDSINIEKYIHKCYDGKGIGGSNPKTTFIAYGAEIRKSSLDDDEESYLNWMNHNGLKSSEYYLIVGRFVPENNYETMIREFMKSRSRKDLAIVTNVNTKFLTELEKKLQFSKDSRIKFVGSLYDQELLMKIRENAYGYLHGHEVGGTNPSLLEALWSTKLNLLLNVCFNKEVATDAAVYWSKKKGDLAELINKADQASSDKIEEFGEKAKQRIKDAYSWQFICQRYMEEFSR